MADKGLTYRDSGVDIEQGDALVERIKPLARRTARPEVLAGIGGFGGLFEVPRGYREPVLVVGTDGVGTKLKLAFLEFGVTWLPYYLDRMDGVDDGLLPMPRSQVRSVHDERLLQHGGVFRRRAGGGCRPARAGNAGPR